jgi:hypothetical protein
VSSTYRRLLQSTELAAVSLLVVVLVLLGIPLKASLASLFLLLVAIVWQCAVGVSIWVRVFKPTRVELVDILGPGLATGAAFTALGWFALCRISWMTPRLFALLTVVVAIDGLRQLKTRYQTSDERQTPVLAVSIAILGLGYHRIGLLVLGIGLITFLGIVNFAKPVAGSISQKIGLFTLPIIGLLILIFAFVVQLIVSNNNTIGFVPDSDSNYNEAIALGVTPDTHLDLSPFNLNFRYHWLSHGWLGVMIRSFKIEPFAGTAVLVPLVVLTSVVCLVFSAYKKWYGSGSLVPIITALLIVAGCSVTDQLVFGNDGVASNQLGTLWMILGGYFLFSFLNQTTKLSTTFVGSALLGLLVMGTKGPLAIVLISASCAHAIFSIYKRQIVLRSIICTVGLIAGSTLAYLVLVSGSNQQSTMSLVYPTKSFASIIFLILFLITTRIPLIYSTRSKPSDLSNRFLALGAAFAMVLNYVFVAKPDITYFLTGPIALSCFFGGLSADLKLKTKRNYLKLIVSLGALIFITTVFLHGKQIYSSVIPQKIVGELKVDYGAKLLNLQNLLVVLSTSLVLFGIFIKKLNSHLIRTSLITIMLATTFGVFVAGASSTELRQRAIVNNNLDGGPDDSQLIAKSIIKSATWIRNNSHSNDIVATNYAISGSRPIGYLVSIATQRSVLIESYFYFFENSKIDNYDTKVKLTNDFSNLPSGATAKALTDIGADYYLFDTTDAQISSADLCADNKIWRCEYKNKNSVVIKFLNQN